MSVGEVNLLQPILAELAQRQPTWEMCHLDHHAHRLRPGAQKVRRLPGLLLPARFHLGRAAAMRRIRPDLLVLAELELWPNLIRAARRQGAAWRWSTAVSARRAFGGYRRIRPLVRRLLQRIDLIAAQNDTYAERFRDLGPARRPFTSRVHQIRRRRDRSRQSSHAEACGNCGGSHRPISCSWPAARRTRKKKWR